MASLSGVYKSLMTQIAQEIDSAKSSSESATQPSATPEVASESGRVASLKEAVLEVVRIGRELGYDLSHLKFRELKTHATLEARNHPALLTTVVVAALATLILEPILFGIGATFASLAVKLVAFTFSVIISTVSYLLSCGITLVSFVLRFLQTCFWWGALAVGLSTAIPLIASHSKAEMKQGFDFFRAACSNYFSSKQVAQ